MGLNLPYIKIDWLQMIGFIDSLFFQKKKVKLNFKVKQEEMKLKMDHDSKNH